jgi:hypothetical protein
MIQLLLVCQVEADHKSQGNGTRESPYLVPRTENKIKIDAKLDEKAWQQALVLELLYEVRPGENVTPSVKTEVLLTFDFKTLYAAFRCYDPDPSSIRAHLRDRDSLGGDDWVGLIFDTFNDQRRSFNFIVTAQGVQFDFIETQNGDDPGWDAIWDCASRITSWGYAVEISIPLSSIGFQRKNGPQVWGFDAVRRYPRQHAYHIGLFPRDRSNNCYLCQAVKIKGFEGVRPGKNIELNPTMIGYRSDARTDYPRGDLEKEEQQAELGITARWGFTPNLTLNLTANPDFNQVEADARQLDINQPFALFYPERRPFFTEGIDFFTALKRVIHTRTVRDPLWGLKLTGKEGSNTIGAFIMRDERTNLIFPSCQDSNSTSITMNNTSSVLRYKRDFGSRYTAGLIFTGREGDDYFNRVYGFDLDFRLSPTNQVQLLVLNSDTRYPDDTAAQYHQKSDTFSGRLISFEYDHNTRTWGWWADYEMVDADFRADLGYFPRVGYRNMEGGINYTWNAPPNKWWALFQVGSEYNHFEDQEGKLLNKRASVWFYYQGILQSGVFIRGRTGRESYHGRQFDLMSIAMEGEFRPYSSLRLGFGANIGDRIDYANIQLGNAYTLDAILEYNLGKHLRLSGHHTHERMEVGDELLYTANISQLTAMYHFNIKTFFRSIIQYVDYDYNPDNYTFEVDSEYKSLFVQLLFSYKINPRTVLFIGYSDNLSGDQDITLTRSDRRFFVKLGYALML